MLDFNNHKMTILDEVPLQYQDEDVYNYLCKHGRTKALDKDVLVAQYWAIEEDYFNGRCWPPLWYWRMYFRIRGRAWCSWYYSEIEKEYGGN